MANFKKTMMAAAGAGGGGGLDVDEVFSTYLYTGNGSSQTITNGIDLAGEGGMVWVKNRSRSATAAIVDTERGASYYISPSESSAQAYNTTANINALNSNGFTVGTSNFTRVNYSGDDYASWTFRKAPKFFDMVTYTGTDVTRTINHNLGSVPGCIIFKNISEAGNWEIVFPNQGSADYLYGYLNLGNSSLSNLSYSNNILLMSAPTSTSIEIGQDDYSGWNKLGSEYIAYFFAHNDGDGGFGPNGDADIIKCGSFPWGSTSGTEVNLGFEPQWILFRAADQAGKDWFIFDALRGIVTGGFSGDGDAALFPNTSGAENVNTWGVDLTPTGFIAYGNNIASSGNIIYMAIRRGPLAVPESATDVFAIDTGAGSGVPMFGSGFPVDVVMRALPYTSAHDKQLSSRLTGIGYGNVENAPWYTDSNMKWDYMDGYFSLDSDQSTWISWMWKRAPGFCDVVTYTGTGANHTITHNLGVEPEMIWLKGRDASTDWNVYHKDSGINDPLFLNYSSAAASNQTVYHQSTPTDSSFTIGTAGDINSNGKKYIAFLFASVEGISKVGSYTGNGTSGRVIDCGFSSGARFILIKGLDIATSWHLWDAERGIVSGNDGYLLLDSSAGENTNTDTVDPNSSGFSISDSIAVNGSGYNYIFYAIA